MHNLHRLWQGEYVRGRIRSYGTAGCSGEPEDVSPAVSSRVLLQKNIISEIVAPVCWKRNGEGKISFFFFFPSLSAVNTHTQSPGTGCPAGKVI